MKIKFQLLVCNAEVSSHVHTNSSEDGTYTYTEFNESKLFEILKSQGNQSVDDDRLRDTPGSVFSPPTTAGTPAITAPPCMRADRLFLFICHIRREFSAFLKSFPEK
jgi:hypothetical protein